MNSNCFCQLKQTKNLPHDTDALHLRLFSPLLLLEGVHYLGQQLHPLSNPKNKQCLFLAPFASQDLRC